MAHRSASAWRPNSVSRWSNTFGRSSSLTTTAPSAKARVGGARITSISVRRQESDAPWLHAAAVPPAVRSSSVLHHRHVPFHPPVDGGPTRYRRRQQAGDL